MGELYVCKKMNIKHIIIITFVVGLWIGAMSIKLKAYGQVGVHVQQGQELLTLIEAYKKDHGAYPDSSWFDELGDKRISSRGRVWVYYNPPLESNEDKKILIAVPIEYRQDYLYGCVGNVTIVRSSNLILNNQAAQVPSPESQ